MMTTPPGVFPIYCQGGPDRCGVDMFLGWYRLNEPVRCPRCGRRSIAIRVKGEVKLKQV